MDSKGSDQERPGVFAQTANSATMQSNGGVPPGCYQEAFTVDLMRQDVGGKVDNFTVLERLGKGGFGTVFKARDEKLGRLVALKFLTDSLDEKRRTLFEREARAIAKLSKHPGIVEIYSWGEHAGHLYFALEYVHSNLGTMIERFPKGMPRGQAVTLATRCAEALAFAHGNGVVHRDIKPANILIDEDGVTPKVADFGLTRLLDSPDTTIGPGISGSPPYMSPEQASGMPLDHRTDIFSLGVTLYEMLCGGRLFDGTTSMEVLAAIRENRRTPIRDRMPDVPDALERVLEKALAHRAENRYQTAREMADDLGRLLNDSETRPLRVDKKAHEAATVVSADPGFLHDQPTVLEPGSPPAPEPEPVQPKGGTRGVLPKVAALVAVAAVCALVLLALNLLTPEKQPLNPGLAMARAALEKGDAPTAAQLYEPLAAGGDSAAQYGLGYALTWLGDLARARTCFASVSDEALREEGLAAAALGDDPAEASTRLGNPQTPYARVLAAVLALGKDDAASALSLLDPVQEDAFVFDWQREEFWRTKGQALFAEGRFDESAALFQRLGNSVREDTRAVAAAYTAMNEARLDTSRREETVRRAGELRALIEQGAGQPGAEPAWTSRPLTYFVLPARKGNSVQAVASGLADTLPMLLGDALDASGMLRQVDRSLISEVLAEQVLSANLSSDADGLMLGKLLGARVIVRPEFARAGGSEFLRLRVVSTETTEVIPVERVDLTAPVNAGEVADALAASLAGAVRDAFPLRGVVTAADGTATLDIGGDLGVEPGMRFAVTASGQMVPGRAVTVRDPVGPASAPVETVGFSVEEMPAVGLMVERIP
jgi:serine/threonine protein kinase